MKSNGKLMTFAIVGIVSMLCMNCATVPATAPVESEIPAAQAAVAGGAAGVQPENTFTGGIKAEWKKQGEYWDGVGDYWEAEGRKHANKDAGEWAWDAFWDSLWIIFTFGLPL